MQLKRIVKVLSLLPCHVYFVDTNNILLWCNDQQTKDIGFTNSADIIGKKIYDLYPKKYAKLLEKNNITTIISGKEQIFKEIINFEGKNALYLSHKVPIKENNQIIGIVGISIDITKQGEIKSNLNKTKARFLKILKKNKELIAQLNSEVTGEKFSKVSDLENIKNFYENLIDKMPGHVYWLDQNCIYQGCNAQQAKSAGLNNRQDIVGKTNKELPWNLQDSSLPEELDRVNRQVMETGQEITTEEPATFPDGSRGHFLSSKVPLRDPKGKIIGLLGVSQDITELKNTQDKLQKTEFLLHGMGLLSASIAHELRTPLSTITMTTTALKKYFGVLVSAYKEMRKIDRSIEYIADDTLNLIEDGIQRIERAADSSNQTISLILNNLILEEKRNVPKDLCSVTKCIFESIDEYTYPLGNRDNIDISRLNDFQFLGDTNLVKYVFFNLMKNAFYFIEKAGKGEISIWDSQIDDYNQIHFRDSGLGIPADKLPFIFNKFYTDRTHHGTGVGLAFCKLVMEKIGGSIECHSEIGKYTEFVLQFPKLPS